MDNLLIKGLTSTPQYKQLQQLREDFDLFSLFDDAIVEDSYSRILAFLLDSRREHNLGQLPFRKWLSACQKEPSAALSAVVNCLSPTTAEVRCEAPWRTHEGRLVDLVAEVLDAGGQTQAVLGIENKLGEEPKEGEDQVSDYQEAIARKWPEPRVPKAILFLSPRGERARTAAARKDCPCVEASYETVVQMCNAIEPHAKDEVQLLVSCLRKHIEQRLLGRSKMTAEARRLVRELYCNPAHRQAIGLIRDFAPTLQTLILALCERYRSVSGRDPAVPVDARGIGVAYPKKSLKADSIWFDVGDLNNIIKHRKDLRFYYVLGSGTDMDIGVQCPVTLVAWNQTKSTAGARDVDALRKSGVLAKTQLPSPFRIGGEPLWSAGKHVLGDLGEGDAGVLSGDLKTAVSATFTPLRNHLQKHLAKP